ncbi:hypothetical protein I6F35_33595 [Bradyrhizobium sp. BRP22]|uniref:hypothetical protein n=1 Tax=Bradyrhizobium sp. BRP22 TaxID=2793821 RepID=UPI001CD25FA5|nr:hypothetical protein [Bradyrhizobium sp. BRP22]MCA1458070.1 hypothetical protein [Bradyrhizobium sp. BRP22]
MQTNLTNQSSLPAKTSPQAPGSSWTPDHAVSRIADNAQNSLAWYGNRAVLQRQLTPAEKESMKNRLSAVRVTLRSATGSIEHQRIERAVAAALTGYGKADQPTVAAYSRLLSDLPAWAVEQACDDIRRGAATGVNPNYPPAAPAIHKLADEKMEGARAEKDRLTLLLTAPVEEARPSATPEERARVSASLQNFHDTVAGNPQESEQRKLERQEAESKRAAHEEHKRRMEYIMQGFEPPTNKHGITMSMSLARAMQLPLTRRKPAPPPRHEFSPEEDGHGNG